MNWLKSKKGIFILSSILVGISIGVYFLLRDTTVLEIKKQTVIFEYGDKVELTARDLLKNTDKDVLMNTKIESNLETEKDKEYPKLGRYQATLSYENEELKINIEIKDTKAPNFNSCNSVEFIKGTDFDYSKYIIATDLQIVNYTWQKETVDIHTVGEYTMTVLASDASNNEVTKEIKVQVLEAVDTTSNEVTIGVDDSGNVKTTVTKKQEVDNSSNSTSTNKDTPINKPNTSNPSATKPDSSIPPQGEKPIPEEDHQHYSSFISPLFDTNEERQQWAENYLFSPENTNYSGYVTSTCSCGKKGVTSFY